MGKIKVGFLSSVFMQAGGIEFYHRNFIAHTRHDVLGICVIAQQEGTADCPMLFGRTGAWELMQKVDVMFCWGVRNLVEYMPPDKPQVVAVHHGDNTNNWSNELLVSNKQWTDHFVCVNRQCSKHMERLLQRPVRYLPNMVPIDRIKPRTTEKELRTLHNLHGKKVVFWCSRLAPEKNPHLAYRIGLQLPEGWVLVMAGDGSHRDGLFTNDKVRVVGNQHPGDWLHWCECYIHTSNEEGFGLSIAEAARAGCQIVSTPVGFANDIPCIKLSGKVSPMTWVQKITSVPRRLNEANIKAAEQYDPSIVQPQWDDFAEEIAKIPRTRHKFHKVEYSTGYARPVKHTVLE